MSKIHCYPNLISKIIIPTRNEFLKSLMPLENQISNLVLTSSEMIDKLSYFISSELCVNVYHSFSYKCPMELIVPVAEYFSESDSTQTTPIHLTLISNPNSTAYLWNNEECQVFFRQLTEVLIHEMVHMRNTRKRNFKNYFNVKFNDDMAILSDPDCIDAYAYNISDDLEYSTHPWKLLRDFKLIKPHESLVLWGYMNTFKQDVNNPIVKKLIKKVYKLLKHRVGMVDNNISNKLL